MLSIAVGPVALPVAPLLLGLAYWGASRLANRVTPKDVLGGRATTAGDAVFHASLWGLVAARLAHLGLNADLYLAMPWAALDVRDGGWSEQAGILVGVAFLGWRAWLRPVLVRPLAIGGAAGLLFWCVASTATGLWQPRTMPALSFIELSGGARVSLAQAARGRPVVVNLWASWCGPCRQEMPLLAAAQQRESEVGFLFVNQGEAGAEARSYLSRQNLPLREVLLDASATLGPAIGSRGLPTTLFFDAQGQMVDAHFGVLNAAALESRLRRLRTNR